MARRGVAISMAMERKEGYLGARVPKELRDRVIQRAREMGIPVSILMRNVLEEAFNERVVGAVAQDVPMATQSAPGGFDAVLGWNRMVLNRSVPCISCGVQLAAGQDVILGLGAAQPVILCDACKSSI